MIAIRTDANNEISIGHVMRCLAIASDLKAFDEEVLFILSSDDAKEILSKKGFRVVVLNNDYKDKDKEIKELKDLMKEYGAECLLLDSYEVTERYMEELSLVIPVIYIDDLVKFSYTAKAIVNYSVDASYEFYLGCKCDQFLLGSKYAPIRRDFREVKQRKVNSGRRHVFISTGGSDHYDMAIHLAKAIADRSLYYDFTLDFVVGKFYRSMNKLQEIAGQAGNILIHCDVVDIWNIMSDSFVAVSAGGTTIVELCVIGVPVITFITAENQRKGVESLIRHNAVVFAGNTENGVDEVVSNIIDALNNFCNGTLDLDYYSRKGRELYDGYGSKRIAQKIIECKS